MIEIDEIDVRLNLHHGEGRKKTVTGTFYVFKPWEKMDRKVEIMRRWTAWLDKQVEAAKLRAEAKKVA